MIRPSKPTWGSFLWASAERPLAEARGLIRHVAGRIARDDVLGVAASLSYTSLLALVPLMAMMLAVLTAFPVFDAVRDQIQGFVFQNFVPAAGAAVQRQLLVFVSATAELTSVGVVGLAITAVLMLLTMEAAFNRIFRVARPRALLGRILVYWTVLTLGPLLIGASFSMASWVTARMMFGHAVDEPLAWLQVVTPYLLTLAAFTLVYVAVPNRRVRLRDGLWGAVVGALLFAAVRFGFVLFVSNVGTYQTVYGTLAAVPIFLLWMFLSWLAVLVGAVIAAALPEWRMHRRSAGAPVAGQRLALALDVLAALDAAVRQGHGLSRHRLLAGTAADEELLIQVLDALRSDGFIARSADGDWMLLRPLDATPLGRLLRVLEIGMPAHVPALSGRPWRRAVLSRLRAARSAEAATLDVPLGHLLGAHRSGEPGSPAGIPD